MLEDELAAQRAENENLEARNRLLEIEVVDLKNGLEAVEERARSELGMIGEDETFYLIID
jgi:cell division protein FtsB